MSGSSYQSEKIAVLQASTWTCLNKTKSLPSLYKVIPESLAFYFKNAVNFTNIEVTTWNTVFLHRHKVVKAVRIDWLMLNGLILIMRRYCATDCHLLFYLNPGIVILTVPNENILHMVGNYCYKTTQPLSCIKNKWNIKMSSIVSHKCLKIDYCLGPLKSYIF